jgi:hypothetical protein
LSLSASPALAPCGIPEAAVDEWLEDVDEAGAADVVDDGVGELAPADPAAEDDVEEPPPHAARSSAVATMAAGSQARERLVRVVDMLGATSIG